MAIDQRALLAYFSSDADFQAWGTGINEQLAACELVQSSDTGQVDWTTVTAPTGADTAAGYEVWEFNDILQSTNPLHLLIEYGCAGADDRPSLWLTVGTGGTDGAGTLNTPVGTRQQIAAQASKTASDTLDSYCSGSAVDGRITLVTNFDPADDSFCCGLSVERMRDGTGAGVGLANATLIWTPSTMFSYQPIPYTGTVPTETSEIPFPSYIADVTTFGGNTALLPCMYATGKMYWGLAQLMYSTPDLTDLTPVSVSYLDGSHVYMPMGTGAGTWGSGTTSIAVIWE